MDREPKTLHPVVFFDRENPEPITKKDFRAKHVTPGTTFQKAVPVVTFGDLNPDLVPEIPDDEPPVLPAIQKSGPAPD